MKNTVIFIVLAALLVNCTYTLPHYLDYKREKSIVISERVGETVDPEERDQFGLFTGIKDFKSAVFYEITDGGYELEIITEIDKLVSVNRNPNTVMVLRDYIDRYEKIEYAMREFEKKWKIVGYDDLGIPITSAEIRHIRKPGRTCLIGAFGGGCLGFLVGVGISAATIRVPFEGDGVPGWFIGLAITAPTTTIGSVTGILSANSVDKNNAIKAIKESRKPRVVE